MCQGEGGMENSKNKSLGGGVCRVEYCSNGDSSTPVQYCFATILTLQYSCCQNSLWHPEPLTCGNIRMELLFFQTAGRNDSRSKNTAMKSFPKSLIFQLLCIEENVLHLNHPTDVYQIPETLLEFP